MDLKGKSLKPDRLALKKKLYQDRVDLTQALFDATDLVEKKYIKKTYDLVNSYIEICKKRNKF